MDELHVAGDWMRSDAVLRVFAEEGADVRVVAARLAHERQELLVHEARLTHRELQRGLAERALEATRSLPNAHRNGGLAIGFPADKQTSCANC